MNDPFPQWVSLEAEHKAGAEFCNDRALSHDRKLRKFMLTCAVLIDVTYHAVGTCCGEDLDSSKDRQGIYQ